MARFISSIFRSIFRKRGWPMCIMTARVTASTGREPTKKRARWGEMVKAITVASTSMMGLRLRERMMRCMVVRTVFTSVVARVMRLGVEKWSMLEKEKLWSFSSSICRRFLAKPWLAMAEQRALSSPQIMEQQAMTIMMPPTVRTKRSRWAMRASGKRERSMKSSSR